MGTFSTRGPSGTDYRIHPGRTFTVTNVLDIDFLDAKDGFAQVVESAPDVRYVKREEAQCRGTTKSGARCKSKAPDGPFCKRHAG